MNPFKSLNLTRKEIGISKMLPITHLNSPCIFEASNTMIGMVLKVDGVTFEAERDEVLNQYKSTWHHALSILDDRFAVYVTTHRHKESIELNATFENDFIRELDRQYHAQFKNSNMYVNDIYITVIFKGVTAGKFGQGINIFNKLSNKAIKGAREASRISQIKQLITAVNNLKVNLSDFNPRILGENDQNLGYSELMSFLSFLVNGGEISKAPFTYINPVINKGIKSAEKIEALYPYGHLAQYLAKKRILFGDYIQFQGSEKDDVTFGAIITIKRYGDVSCPIMFDTFLHLDTDFICTHSYLVQPKDIALKNIKLQEARLKNIDDDSISQVNALKELRDLIASDKTTMGYHHNTILILSKSIGELENKISSCIKCYNDVGFVALRETVGQEPAFWAQMPTNIKFIARSSMITAKNFVDFASLHNYRTGYKDENHLGSAVTIVETPSKTPFFLNLHVRGSKDNPSKGHALIVGGNNSGKTVLMKFLECQLARYQGYSFYFDRDRGAKIATLAQGGSYSELTPDNPNETKYSPLKIQDTPSNRQFARDLLVQLCRDNENDVLDSTVIEVLTNCIDYAFEKLDYEHRTLSNATNLLPVNFPKWPSLRRWLRAKGNHPDGNYAYIFDNYEDNLKFQKHMGFDMTHFLDHEPVHIRTPVLMYLFQRIEEFQNGKLCSVFLDEGWQYFIDPYWQGKLRRILPTWRKKNAHIIIGTQSPSSIVESPLKNTILDNVASQFYFANPQAKRSDYIDGLSLTPTEYEIIKSNTPQSRLFLFKQDHESTLCKLNLAHMPNKLAILSGNTATVNLVNKLRNEVSEDPNIWLPLFHKERVELRS